MDVRNHRHDRYRYSRAPPVATEPLRFAQPSFGDSMSDQQRTEYGKPDDTMAVSSVRGRRESSPYATSGV